jgi:hypothetical protein
MMDVRADDVFPPLRGRPRRLSAEHIEMIRRELLRAFEHGALTEEELATTLDRLGLSDATVAAVRQSAPSLPLAR